MVQLRSKLVNVVGAPCKFPVRGHCRQPQSIDRRNQRLPLGRHRQMCPVERVTVIQRDHTAGVIRAYAVEQCLDPCKTAQLGELRPRRTPD